MDYIYIGKIVTTHGLNGEVKVKSNFQYKKQIFIKGNKLYIGLSPSIKEEHEILNYRPHQGYDMVILSDIDDIDKAIKYKQKSVYVLKSDIVLNDNDYLDEDLIGLDCFYENKKIGVIKSVTDEGNNNIILRLDKGIYIPKNSNFITSIDLGKKEIHFQNIGGLL